MGIRIFYPSGTKYVVSSFSEAELNGRSVKLWCNVQTNEHNLICTKSHSKKRPVLMIEFSLASFRSISVNGTDKLREFSKILKSERHQKLSGNDLLINAEMQRCIYDLTHYGGSESLKRFYFYSKIVELLMLQQSCFEASQSEKPIFVKNEYDKERIIFARDYLLTHLDAPPSLPELAAIAGINEFKLKRGFKEIFNQSVFAYLAEVRLQMARTALQQKQKSISLIAFELGYASLQHFSAAFKKKYGVAPRVEINSSRF